MSKSILAALIISLLIILIFWIFLPDYWFHALIGAGFIMAMGYHISKTAGHITNKNGGAPEANANPCVKYNDPKIYAKTRNEAIRSAKRHYGNETNFRNMLNCYCSGGQFNEVSPGQLEWLRDGNIYLSLDGYNNNFNVAFEYQGVGHYWDVYDNIYKYYLGRHNDLVKKQKLANQRIPLILVHCDIPFKDHVNWIKSRLFDLDLLREEYYIVTPATTHEPEMVELSDGKYIPKSRYPEPIPQDIEKIKKMTNIQEGRFMIGGDLYTSQLRGLLKK